MFGAEAFLAGKLLRLNAEMDAANKSAKCTWLTGPATDRSFALNRTMLAAFLAIYLPYGATALAAPAETPQARAADIAAVLQSSAVAWSRGDLDAFMQSYEPSAAVTYVGKTGLVRGYTAIHDMYAGRFGTGKRMGGLTLQVLESQDLGPDYALVTGRFALARPKQDGGDATGIFTLVFHRTALGWRILNDHTS